MPIMRIVTRVRNTLILTAIVLATAAAPAAAVVLHPASCSSCGSLTASGDGWVGQTMTGTGWGSVDSGTIWVKDLSPSDGSRDWKVSNSSSHAYLGNGVHRYKGSNMTFVAWTHWWVKVSGSDVAVSTVAAGSAYIQGVGQYHVNGGAAKSWPKSTPVHITLRG